MDAMLFSEPFIFLHILIESVISLGNYLAKIPPQPPQERIGAQQSIAP